VRETHQSAANVVNTGAFHAPYGVGKPQRVPWARRTPRYAFAKAAVWRDFGVPTEERLQMKDIIDLFSKLLLEKDIRAKNAASLLVALLSVAVFYFASRHSQWFQDVEGYGGIGVGVALLVVFLIAFLAVGLVYSGMTTYYQYVVSRQRAQQEAEQQQKTIRDNLDNLTDWQRKFLLRFIVEDRRQIPEFELGQFKAGWDFEVAVLVKKRIVKEHRRAGVYEIEPIYLDYLKANWNPEAGTLG
jgi:hypothetical protein